MSYHFTIIRKARISMDEVASVLQAMPGVHFSRLPEESGFVVNRVDSDVKDCHFHYTDGVLWAKNVDRAQLQLLIDVASLAGGRIRGDELETYRTPDITYIHGDDRGLRLQEQDLIEGMLRKTRRNRFIFNVTLISFFLTLAALVNLFSRSNLFFK